MWAKIETGITYAGVLWIVLFSIFGHVYIFGGDITVADDVARAMDLCEAEYGQRCEVTAIPVKDK